MNNTKQVSLSRSQRGTSIIESMLSIMLFGFFLLVIVSAFFMIGRIYFKAATENKTQQTVRNIVDSLSEAVRTAGIDIKPLECRTVDGGEVSVSPPQNSKMTPCESVNHLEEDHWKGYCVGGVGYIYRLGQQLKQVNLKPPQNGAFWLLRSCDATKTAYQNLEDNKDKSIELLQPQMRLVKFDLRNDVAGGSGTDNRLWLIDAKVAFGGDSDSTEEAREHDEEIFRTDDDKKRPEIVGCKPRQTFCAVARLRTLAYQQIRIIQTPDLWYFRGYAIISGRDEV